MGCYSVCERGGWQRKHINITQSIIKAGKGLQEHHVPTTSPSATSVCSLNAFRDLVTALLPRAAWLMSHIHPPAFRRAEGFFQQGNSHLFGSQEQ